MVDYLFISVFWFVGAFTVAIMYFTSGDREYTRNSLISAALAPLWLLQLLAGLTVLTVRMIRFARGK